MRNFIETLGASATGKARRALLFSLLASALAAPGTDARAQTAPVFTTLYNFGGSANDGTMPYADLIQGGDGDFYGTTYKGGAGGTGTIFSITSAGALTTLHSFSALAGNHTNSDGATPFVRLLQGSDGNFYGTTQAGGANAYGTVFQMTPAGVLTTLYSFTALNVLGTNLDGAVVSGGLVQGGDGNFYDTTEDGNPNASGTVFKVTPAGALSTLYDFSVLDTDNTNSDGSNPSGGLSPGNDGNFYGTTYYGGVNGDGGIFRVTPAGKLTPLYDFSGTDGAYPSGGLTLGSDGNFYGTTQVGGANKHGTVFQMTPAGVLTSLYSFSAGNSDGTNDDGISPYAGLIEGRDGNFYGTTHEGGASAVGTVFQITPAGALTTLHSFSGGDGASPTGRLLQGSDGVLYGTTTSGGSSEDGTVFALRLSPLPVVTLSVTTPAVTLGSGGSGEFTLNLSAAQSSDIVVNYTIQGDAINGTDYEPLSGTKTFKAGKTSKPIKIVPLGNLNGAAKRSVKLGLAPGVGYTVGTSATEKVKILSGQ